ncbi:complex III assembly factor LYRM7-like [Ctenocephalides felis]|uniref:complex III assembly factor LYRM7-like n=1 Tax=Ctenocephalides felis TaxID=7515 RepID=UPI000E6E35AB|nr:complex III assembly factor LYRM7-like [Ctenocephalides felis]
MSNLRAQVLRSFKELHRARKSVFAGDDVALKACRDKINEGFFKNKHVTNSDSINELLVFANAVAKELRQTVIQAKEVSPGKYEARITKDTQLLDNVEFKLMPDEAYKVSPKSKCKKD